MNLGAWCLVAFSTTAASAVGADLLDRPRAARALGAATSLLGGYLGSYTGVLLATTAVPLWARSRSVLGPVFVCTAAASGAAATRLTLTAAGMSASHPTQRALGNVETASILAELALSSANHRHLGDIGAVMHTGRPGLLYRTAETAVTLGVSTRLVSRWMHPRVRDVASLLFLAGALAFRFAWMEGGKASAADHPSVAAMARGSHTLGQDDVTPRGPSLASDQRRPTRIGGLTRHWSETVRRASLLAERVLRR
jgi:formate-dependent nitrite reductase membrane component NrfD